MRKYIILLLLLLVPLALTGWTLKRGPSQTEIIMQTWMLFDAAIDAAECANGMFGGNGVACTSGNAIIYFSDAWSITRASIVIDGVAWSANEACDVDIDLNASTIATFIVGPTGLAAAGDTAETTTFTTTSMAAGSKILIRHDDPAGATCIAEAACDCDAASASYLVTIWGVRR